MRSTTDSFGVARDRKVDNLPFTSPTDYVVSSLKDRVEKALDELRPNLQADGGNVELVDVKDGVVKVRLTGACAGCPMSQMTLQWGVTNFLKKKIPEIVQVEAVP